MMYRVESLLKFLACECSESEDGANNLLTETNMRNACEMDMYKNVWELKNEIYETYLEFGIDHAMGVFEVTVVESFNL